MTSRPELVGEESVSVDVEVSGAKLVKTSNTGQALSPSPALMAETDPEDVRPISVSLEIKRFQEEINKVQAENCKFYQWKLRRVSSRTSLAPSLPPRGISQARSQESILSPGLSPLPPVRPPKKKANKKVSYCDAVTVFGSSESLGSATHFTIFAHKNIWLQRPCFLTYFVKVLHI